MLTPTIDNINRMLNLALEDPAGKQVFAKDWRVFMTTHFALDPEQNATWRLEAAFRPIAWRPSARGHERRREWRGHPAGGRQPGLACSQTQEAR